MEYKRFKIKNQIGDPVAALKQVEQLPPAPNSSYGAIAATAITPVARDVVRKVGNFMNCRRCGNQINGLWNEWELCDKCGYRYHVGAQRSPDGDCQPIVQQPHAVHFVHCQSTTSA